MTDDAALRREIEERMRKKTVIWIDACGHALFADPGDRCPFCGNEKIERCVTEEEAVDVVLKMVKLERVRADLDAQTRIIFALRELHIGAGTHDVTFVAWKDGRPYIVQPDKITGIFTALERHCAEVYKSAKQAVSDYEAGYRKRAEAAEALLADARRDAGAWCEQAREAEAHVRNHHLEACETCATNESALEAALTAEKALAEHLEKLEAAGLCGSNHPCCAAVREVKR